VHSSALIDGLFCVGRLQQPNDIGSVAAHIPIGFTGQRHRHSGVVRLTGHRQDSVLPIVLGLHQFSSARAELLCSKDDRVLRDRLQNVCASARARDSRSSIFRRRGASSARNGAPVRFTSCRIDRPIVSFASAGDASIKRPPNRGRSVLYSPSSRSWIWKLMIRDVTGRIRPVLRRSEA
jgi:hypothetical protein